MRETDDRHTPGNALCPRSPRYQNRTATHPELQRLYSSPHMRSASCLAGLGPGETDSTIKISDAATGQDISATTIWESESSSGKRACRARAPGFPFATRSVRLPVVTRVRLQLDCASLVFTKFYVLPPILSIIQRVSS